MTDIHRLFEVRNSGSIRKRAESGRRRDVRFDAKLIIAR